MFVVYKRELFLLLLKINKYLLDATYSVSVSALVTKHCFYNLLVLRFNRHQQQWYMKEELTTVLVRKVDSHDSETDSHDRVGEDEEEAAAETVDQAGAGSRRDDRHYTYDDSGSGRRDGSPGATEYVNSVVDDGAHTAQTLEGHQTKGDTNGFCCCGSVIHYLTLVCRKKLNFILQYYEL